MKKSLLNLTIILLTVVTAQAQSYGEFIQKLVQNSPQMRALHSTFTADSLEQRRGLNPDDPELEMEYYVGKEQSMEMTFKQKFDFPTVYHNRNKLSKYSIERLQADQKGAYLELMLTASELYNTLVYQSQVEKIISTRASSYRKLIDAAKKYLDSGMVTIVEYQKIGMRLTEAENELTQIQAQLENTKAQLAQLGAELDPSTVSFAAYAFNGSMQEFVQAAREGNGALQAARVDSLIANRSLKLARSEWIPGLLVGYKFESEIKPIAEGQRHAIVAGITIPLWKNRNNVKHSKALIQASSDNLRVVESKLDAELKNIYTDYQAAQKSCTQWENIKPKAYSELLDKSLMAGSISLIDYLFELSDLQIVQMQIAEANYRRALLGGQMALYLY